MIKHEQLVTCSTITSMNSVSLTVDIW